MAHVAMIGATGLIGSSLAPALVAAGHDLTLVSRREAGISDAREIVAAVEDWPAALADWRGEVAISTLGTTWRKARSWPAFRAVDIDAVLAFAKAAQEAGARQFMLVSSVGAKLGSRSAYLGLKGEVEAALRELSFERIDIVRPGLLRGERAAERRMGERLGNLISPFVNRLLLGPLNRYQAIDAARVARAIAAIAGASEIGVFIHHNREIQAMA
jgi:uncharacterized protein YbjT (DUF2867 family)